MLKQAHQVVTLGSPISVKRPKLEIKSKLDSDDLFLSFWWKDINQQKDSVLSVMYEDGTVENYVSETDQKKAQLKLQVQLSVFGLDKCPSTFMLDT
jgi:hypothetical protein